MTFYHFVNCLALAYAPYHMTYKQLGLAEYGAFWKCGMTGLLYMATLILKMLFMATCFPMADDDDDLDDDVFRADNGEAPFVFISEFMKATVDLADLLGLYWAVHRVSGKGRLKFVVAGLGWAFAELALTRVIFLWVGARGVEFDWKYMRESLDANISLVHFITMACLVLLAARVVQQQQQGQQQQQPVLVALAVLLMLAAYRNLAVNAASSALSLGVWTTLAYRAAAAAGVALLTAQIYVTVTAGDAKY